MEGMDTVHIAYTNYRAQSFKWSITLFLF